MPYEIPYHGEHEWMTRRVIYFCLYGSRAIGTARPDSDEDYRGICVPPRRYREGIRYEFNEEIVEQPVDLAIFDVRKFVKLAAGSNAGFLEFLFVEPEDLLVCTPQGQLLRDHRHDFLSRKTGQSFRAYAYGQLRKIDSHRHWLLNPPTHYPTREEFGLPASTEVPKEQLNAALAAIKQRIDGWEIDFFNLPDSSKVLIKEQVSLYLAELPLAADAKFQAAARLMGSNDNLLEILRKERVFRQAVADWKSYQAWKSERNEKRAELEAKFGYDTKHGSHLVRLMTMAQEILTQGTFKVRRPDAKWLMEIRNGAMTYEQLVAWAKAQNKAILDAEIASALPLAADEAKLDKLCVDIIQSMDGVAE